MKKSANHQSGDHPTEWMVSYLEGMPVSVDRSSVERHFAECEECSGKLKGLSALMNALKPTKAFFAPSRGSYMILSKRAQILPARLPRMWRSALSAGKRLPA
jgi:hypothetical protein